MSVVTRTHVLIHAVDALAVDATVVNTFIDVVLASVTIEANRDVVLGAVTAERARGVAALAVHAAAVCMAFVDIRLTVGTLPTFGAAARVVATPVVTRGAILTRV